MTSLPTQPTWDQYGSADEYAGAQINALMFRSKMTRRELGGILGIEGAAAGRKLRGDRAWSLDELLAVARHFQVPVTDLLPGNDYDPVLGGRGRVDQYAIADSNREPAD